jgi:hypothetical protein
MLTRSLQSFLRVLFFVCLTGIVAAAIIFGG